MLNNIEKFRFYCQRILPLAYDDSLSYVEVLYKVSNKLNEIITNYNELIGFYNTIEGTLDEINAKIVEIDNRIAGFTSELMEFERNITTTLNIKIEELDAKFDNLSNELRNEIEVLSSRIDSEISQLTIELNALINQQLTDIRAEMRLNNYELKEWVEVRLQEFLDEIPAKQNVMVVDPTNGKLVLLQIALNNMFEYSRYGAITADEYDNLKLTATQYDNFVVNYIPRGLTAYQYDFYARRFYRLESRVEMFNGYTGNKDESIDVINRNTDMFKVSGSLTATEYDNIEIDAERYDELELTAYTYDWHSNTNVA